jgi:hypothetical protein
MAAVSMTSDDSRRPRPSRLQFGLLGFLLFVSVVALWLAMWRAVGLAGILFVTAYVPFGLIIYAAACVGARCGHPMLNGVLAGLGFGVLGMFFVYGWLAGHPLDIGDFAHLTTTGLAVGLACGALAWLKNRRRGSSRR